MVTSTQLAPQATRAPQSFAQTPPLQKGVGAAHEAPQEPHVAALERSASHPLSGAPSQSPKPAPQANPHDAPSQVAVAFGGAAQGVQESPQLDGLVSSTQTSAQRWVPDAQVGVPVLSVELEVEELPPEPPVTPVADPPPPEPPVTPVVGSRPPPPVLSVLPELSVAPLPGSKVVNVVQAATVAVVAPTTRKRMARIEVFIRKLPSGRRNPRRSRDERRRLASVAEAS